VRCDLPVQDGPDYDPDDEQSGSVDAAGPREAVLRLALILLRPWDAALAAPATRQFTELAAGLSRALEGLYTRVPGRQAVTVVSFRWGEHRSWAIYK
jgi:hypothetical protein